MPTSFGQQAALFLPRIKAAGFGVTHFAIGGCDGAPALAAGGIMVLPRAVDPFGADIVEAHFKATGSDVLISLIDPHVLDPSVYGKMPWCAWAPVDSMPIPPATARSLKAARWVWAPSKFSEEQIAPVHENVTFVPHGVDSKIFGVPEDREAVRERVGARLGVDLRGKFLVVMVAANKSRPSRKGFYEAFRAFAKFVASRPDALLYVHTEVTGMFGGEDLREVAKRAGLEMDKILAAPQYQYICGMLDAAYLAGIYAAADVFLSASHGEGFGLPLVEAQMCGCPVVAPRSSAQTEVRFEGVGVHGGEAYAPSFGTYWARPSPDELAVALGNVVVEGRPLARARAMVFDADTVFEKYMLPALRKIEKEIA